MSDIPSAAAAFTPPEREYIRRELGMFFSTLPRVADGFRLRTWRSGPLASQPKLSPAGKSLVERNLMRVDTTTRVPRLFFTDEVLLPLNSRTVRPHRLKML